MNRSLGVALIVLMGCGGAAADGGAKSEPPGRGGAATTGTEGTGTTPKDETTVAAAPTATAAAPNATAVPPDDPADPLRSRGGVSAGGASVQGKLPPEVIARVVRSGIGPIRACYEQGLSKAPSLRGTVKIKFTIGPDGHVVTAQDDGSQIGNASVVECVRAALRKLTFPQPEGGTVTVVYPFVFEPG